ncbi:MAG: quinate 5-dehydrogenase [Anaerolineaceae bacterium]|nr:MAG: quinate 5-dehydrogenase [Anaerolineaceae bacterium]
MKKILSISVGSSSRDHTARHTFLSEECEISRQGTDGDFEKAIQRYADLDGKVDAFGVGGLEFYLRIDQKRWYFRDVARIRRVVMVSKIGDGNGVKGILERRAFQALEKHLNEKENKTLQGMPALITTAVERFGMAEAMMDAGLDLTFGDFMFALGLPIAVRKVSTVRLLGHLLLPIITQMPFSWFYALGSEQDKPPQPKWDKYYKQATVLGGDFIQIRQYMPNDLAGKIIVTNTTTSKNVDELKKRNLHILVTTTPRLEGHSFGTNVMEATLLALMDKPQSEVTDKDFLDLIEQIPLEPNIEVLNP